MRLKNFIKNFYYFVVSGSKLTNFKLQLQTSHSKYCPQMQLLTWSWQLLVSEEWILSRSWERSYCHYSTTAGSLFKIGHPMGFNGTRMTSLVRPEILRASQSCYSALTCLFCKGKRSWETAVLPLVSLRGLRGMLRQQSKTICFSISSQCELSVETEKPGGGLGRLRKEWDGIKSRERKNKVREGHTCEWKGSYGVL